MAKIPMVDLKAQYEQIKDEIKTAIDKVINSTNFILGEFVEEFENNFAKYCGTKYAVGTSSGTTALHLALVSAGIGKDDEVITTPYTFIATTEAITHAGADIVFADIDEKTYNIDPSRIIKAITKKTRAIIPVHIYGQTASMSAIMDIAKKYDLVVVEDSAQAHGAKFKEMKAGSMGDAGCFSFFPGKNLGAYGDGGAVTTNSKELAEKMRMLCNHGRKNKYEHQMEGYNYRLDAMQAAILNVKLKYMDDWNNARRQNAQYYNELLKNNSSITLPYNDPNCHHIYHLYVIRHRKRNELEELLKKNDIASGVHYPIPLHLQPAYKRFWLPRGSFPISEKCADEALSLPMYPELSRENIKLIAGVVNSL